MHHCCLHTPMTLASGSNNSRLPVVEPPRRRSFIWQIVNLSIQDRVVVVVCPLQPSSSVHQGCPCPESSVRVPFQLACSISSQVTDHWGEPCNRTGEVHPVDPFHFASIAFCRNSVSLQGLEQSCDRVVLCRLDKWVSSSLMDGGRLLSTLHVAYCYIDK